MNTYALIGKSLQHSLSKKYFSDKFKKNRINNYEYINIELDKIHLIKDAINTNSLSGFNVTSPYKQAIIPYLKEISKSAESINAVNTVKVINKEMYGYNTDIIGFEKSISPLIKNRNRALILGSGGSSKSVQYTLNKLNMKFKVVSRGSLMDYSDLSKEIIEKNEIIINCTPVGTYPNHNEYPPIPYKYLNPKHLLFDLVYNPSQTKFLSFGLKYNSEIKNGLEMLKIQADESWKIWNSNII